MNNTLGWLMRLNVPDKKEYAKIALKVIQGERDGKDMREVKKELEAKYGFIED